MSQPLLPIHDAQALVRQETGGRLGTERAPIDAGLDRVLAADIRAGGDVPRFRSSAMDGFAVRGPAEGDSFRVVGESRAGQPYTGALRPGEAVRISTGAVVPDDADAVLRQEDVVSDEIGIESRVSPGAGMNIRPPGEDMRAGQVVVTTGTWLGPVELGAAVAAGAGNLTLARRPLVAVLCTGDELRPPGEPLAPGQIHNSNAPMLRALAVRSGSLAAPAGHLPDEPGPTERALEGALGDCDVVIVSGGVSVGPHDHVKPALTRLGVQEHFWGVALQPGKPTWFGTRQGRVVFGLPGNPVSAAVTFSLFVRLALESLLGAEPRRAPVSHAALAAQVRRNPGRDQALRVRLDTVDGVPVVMPAGGQGSHMFTSLLAADCLAIVPRGEGVMAAGERVCLEPLPA